MSAPFKRGEASNQVSNLFPSTNKVTPSDLVSTFVPHGLRLQQTIQSSGSVTIPAGIEWVYVVMTGAGGSGGSRGGGGAGGVSWGWTLAQSTCIIGAAATNAAGGYTRYGHIIAGGGNSGTLGSGGAGGNTGNGNVGATNYWGSPNGAAGTTGLAGGVGSGAGGGGGGTPRRESVGGPRHRGAPT